MAQQGNRIQYGSLAARAGQLAGGGGAGAAAARGTISAASLMSGAVNAGLLNVGDIGAVSAGAVRTVEMSEASRRSRDQQEDKMRMFRIQKAQRTVVVPTIPAQVQAALRRHGHPIQLFGENVADRRERLKFVMACLEVDSTAAEKAERAAQDEARARAAAVALMSAPDEQEKERLRRRKEAQEREVARLRRASKLIRRQSSMFLALGGGGRAGSTFALGGGGGGGGLGGGGRKRTRGNLFHPATGAHASHQASFRVHAPAPPTRLSSFEDMRRLMGLSHFDASGNLADGGNAIGRPSVGGDGVGALSVQTAEERARGDLAQARALLDRDSPQARTTQFA